jgi:hypothetical protein
MQDNPEVNLNLIDISIQEHDFPFSLFDLRTWFWWKYRRFRVTFTIPATEGYEVSECFGIPQVNPSHGYFECLLLIHFKESPKKTQKINSFFVPFSCPSHLSQVTFNLAVQVKHPVHVSL